MEKLLTVTEEIMDTFAKGFYLMARNNVPDKEWEDLGAKHMEWFMPQCTIPFPYPIIWYTDRQCISVKFCEGYAHVKESTTK